MTPIDKHPEKTLMGRRELIRSAAALGAGVGLSAPILASCDNVALASDQDLKFIGVEETFSTSELMQLNSLNEDHIEFLTEIGLADLGDRRIGDMDEGGLNVQILSAHTPSVQMSLGKRGSTSPTVSTGSW